MLGIHQIKKLTENHIDNRCLKFALKNYENLKKSPFKFKITYICTR